MNKIKIGLMCLYIKLYDDCKLQEIRDRSEAFYEKLAQALEGEGFEVVRNPICCVKDEFQACVDKFEAEGVQCMVTWHAAYSPSLESIDVLAATKLPIVVLDTTETLDFSPTSDPAEINMNHGIHGVMDMTNMLMRRGKPYAIAAGHYPTSDVIKKTAGLVRSAAGAVSLKGTKVGTIGGSFDGMVDFLISDKELLETFGVTAVYAKGDELTALRNEVTDEEIKAEIEYDMANFQPISEISAETHEKTERNCLAVRKWIEKEDLSEFTVKFREIRPENGIVVMPFVEASKAMARGVGYAGEGDVLTASITGALMRGFPETAFVEIFCPDWKNGSVCLSHMGEINLALTAQKPEIKEIPFVFGEADDPVVCYGCYKSGEAVFVNVYRDEDKYNMLISPVEMLDNEGDKFAGTVRGWMKPKMPLGDFLEKISRAGVTHHSSLVYNASLEELEFFGKILGLNVVVVK